MKMRTLLGVAAIGGLYYAHRKRGGELTVASIKDSLNALRAAVIEQLKTMEAATRQPPNTARSYEDYERDLH